MIQPTAFELVSAIETNDTESAKQACQDLIVSLGGVNIAATMTPGATALYLLGLLLRRFGHMAEMRG